MNLFDKIVAIYPELKPEDFTSCGGTIALQNDSDGQGDYIKAWDHPTLAEPTAEQLALGGAS